LFKTFAFTCALFADQESSTHFVDNCFYAVANSARVVQRVPVRSVHGAATFGATFPPEQPTFAAEGNLFTASSGLLASRTQTLWSLDRVWFSMPWCIMHEQCGSTPALR